MEWALEEGAKNAIGIDDRTNDGVTPLHQSLLSGAIESAVSLVKHGASVTVKDNTGGGTLHMVAAQKGGRMSIDVALSHGCTVNDLDTNGRTPLMYSAWGDEKESVEFLLSKGADPTRVGKVFDKNGDTALGIAKSDEVRTILETATLEFIEKKKKIKAKVTEAVAVAAAEAVLAELELKAEKAKKNKAKNERKKRKKKEDAAGAAADPAAGAAAAALELQATEAFNLKKPTATPPSAPSLPPPPPGPPPQTLAQLALSPSSRRT